MPGLVNRSAGYRVSSLVLRLRRPRLRLGLAVAALAILAMVMTAGAAGRPPVEKAERPAATCGPGTLSPGNHLIDVDVAETPRQVLIHMPPGSGNARIPLVLAFHGAGGSGPAMAPYSGLSRLADRAGFAVAYPSAAGPRHVWELGGREDEPSANDIAFARRLLNVLPAQTCADAARLGAVGVSNGGGFVARLGCVVGDRLAGIVVVAGGFSAVPPCATGRPLSVLEIHGTDDPVVPYNGRAGLGSVPTWLAAWRSRDGCPTRSHQAQAAARVRRFDWLPCRNGSVVVHLRISGGKHQWPGAVPADPGPASTISAADEAWRFLVTRRLKQPER